MRWTRLAVPIMVVALLPGVRPAAAEDATIAEQLYRDGQKLIAAGKTHEACLKFSDSERADHALGTLVAMAACHEREGKVASAWTEFGEATELAERNRDATRARYARSHAAALAPRVRRVRIEVKPPVAGMTLQLEGKSYGEGTLGSAIPLDPGEYPIEVRAPGKKTFSRTLTVGTSGGEERVTVTLDDLPKQQAPEPAVAPPVPSPSPSASPPAPAREPSSGARTAGFVVGGVGVALGVVAVVLEANASSLSRKSQDDARSANASGSDAAYQSAAFTHDDAVSTQRLALAAGGLAVVALSVGAYLVLSAPSTRDGSSRAGARVIPIALAGGGGLAVGGGF